METKIKSTLLADMIELAKLAGYESEENIEGENAKNLKATEIDRSKGNIRQIQLG